MFIAGLLLSGCTETVTTSQVFPDPYVMGQGSNEVVFIDLAAVCTIEITMLDGSLVRRISETDGDGQASWDLKNQAGEDVVSGIYLYLIKSQSQEAKGRLIINK
ncbi:MAG: T9SS type A sorting domain-containing protein [Candidatus Saganbacteria bacterium]|nr:T9SS type A sorting domain-containing protein [Candidatus Saganbacteria bacterium]